MRKAWVISRHFYKQKATPYNHQLLVQRLLLRCPDGATAAKDYLASGEVEDVEIGQKTVYALTRPRFWRVTKKLTVISPTSTAFLFDGRCSTGEAERINIGIMNHCCAQGHLKSSTHFRTTLLDSLHNNVVEQVDRSYTHKCRAVDDELAALA